VAASVTFTIPIKPVPGGKAEMARSRTGKPFMYDPIRSKVWKKQAQPFINQAFAGREPFSGPVAVDVQFFFQYPKSWSKKKKARTVYPTNKNLGDLDRLLNLLYDSMSGVAYHDDSQVVRGSQEKFYSTEEKLKVTVSPLGGG